MLKAGVFRSTSRFNSEAALRLNHAFEKRSRPVLQTNVRGLPRYANRSESPAFAFHTRRWLAQPVASRSSAGPIVLLPASHAEPPSLPSPHWERAVNACRTVQFGTAFFQRENRGTAWPQSRLSCRRIRGQIKNGLSAKAGIALCTARELHIVVTVR